MRRIAAQHLKSSRPARNTRRRQIVTRANRVTEHIHLLGIAGAAMAPVAGMLKERGYHVTGSDVNVYPPASTLLDALGIRWHEGFRPENLQPAPDLCVVGNVIARGNPEIEYILDEKLPYCSMPQLLEQYFIPGPHLDCDCRNARQNHHHSDARVDFSRRRAQARFSGRRRLPKFWRPQLWPRRRGRIHHRGRRIRDRLLRPRPEISPLSSGRADSHLARIRPCGHLPGSSVHRRAIPQAGESGPAPRKNSHLGRERRTKTNRRQSILPRRNFRLHA